MIPYCAPPDLAAIVESVNGDPRGWPVQLALDCEEPEIVFVRVPFPIDCGGVVAVACTRFGRPCKIEVSDLVHLPYEWEEADLAAATRLHNLRMGPWNGWVIEHELGWALYHFPLSMLANDGLMGMVTPWPSDQELLKVASLDTSLLEQAKHD